MDSKIEIGLLLAWLIVFGMVLAIGIFFFNYRSKVLRIEKENQKKTFRAAIDAEERTKENTANNLHDETITFLTSVVQNLEALQNKANRSVVVPADLQKEIDTLNQSIQGIRSISLGLVPTTFLNFGLIRSVEQYARQLNPDTIALEFHNDFKLNTVPFNKNEQLGIYRICQEVLNNLFKHAGYKYLRITISNDSKNLLIQFTHDGAGVNNEEMIAFSKASTGLGLQSMKSRQLFLGANIDYNKDDTPIITLTVPFLA